MKRRALVAVIEPQPQWLAGLRRFDRTQRCDFRAWEHLPEETEIAACAGFAMALCNDSLELLRRLKDRQINERFRPAIIGLCGNDAERLAWLHAGADAAITEFAEISSILSMFVRAARLRKDRRKTDQFAIEEILPW